MKTQYASQGVTKNLPQYGTSFWGNSANNYGFGMTNITDNIANIKNTTNQMQIATAVPQQQTQNSDQLQTQEQNPLKQIAGTLGDMITEYYKMREHGYKYLDDYHHCKANYNAAARGSLGYNMAQHLGNAKEIFDFYWNQWYKGKNLQEALVDKNHDLDVNAIGRQRGYSGLYNNAQEACADYRLKNPSFPKKYW